MTNGSRPFCHSWAAIPAVLQATCETLMGYPDRNAPAGLRPVAEAASRAPRISRGGRRYTFVVRRGLRFSNGHRLGQLDEPILLG